MTGGYSLFEQAASRVAHIPEYFLGIDEDEQDPTQRARQQRQARTLMGALWYAGAAQIDYLFDDLLGIDGSERFVDIHFPERFAHKYDVVFIRKLIVAAADLSGKLVKDWDHPDCVAQELLTRMLLNIVEIQQDMYDLDLPPHWRPMLEEYLFEDLDHEFLFDPAADGFENDPDFGPPGMVKMDFKDWFTPFADRSLPPYLIDTQDIDDALESRDPNQ